MSLYQCLQQTTAHQQTASPHAQHKQTPVNNQSPIHNGSACDIFSPPPKMNTIDRQPSCHNPGFDTARQESSKPYLQPVITQKPHTPSAQQHQQRSAAGAAHHYAPIRGWGNDSPAVARRYPSQPQSSAASITSVNRVCFVHSAHKATRLGRLSPRS
jgi:hypothetical protein